MPSANPKHHQLTSDGALRVYDTDELLRMPPPTWQIQDVIPANGFVGLYGPSGGGKTFVALDMALSVASGRPWQGKEVEPGFVIYVSAEGTSGLGKRIRAWMAPNGITNTSDLDIGWITEGLPVYAGSESLEALFARFAELDRNPDLVILDTLARCFEGDENLQKDMNPFVAGVDRIRTELGATVIIVHHTNADASRERGNTAFRGAANTMICVTPGILGSPTLKNDGMPGPFKTLFNIVCNKQKDAADFLPGQGKLAPVEGTESCHAIIEWMEKPDGV